MQWHLSRHTNDLLCDYVCYGAIHRLFPNRMAVFERTLALYSMLLPIPCLVIVPLWAAIYLQLVRLQERLEHNAAVLPRDDMVRLLAGLHQSGRSTTSSGPGDLDPSEGLAVPWQQDASAYGRAVLSQRYRECEGDVAATLTDLLSNRLAYAAKDNERFFNAVQTPSLSHRPSAITGSCTMVALKAGTYAIGTCSIR
jgi:hypothetical protein